MMTTELTKRQRLHGYSAYTLSNIAECAGPDTLNGAEFLTGIRRDVLDRHANDELDEDSPAEIADSAVPIYTHPLWETFVDLAAYREDVSEHVIPGRGNDEMARVALYIIAERLAAVLIADLTDES